MSDPGDGHRRLRIDAELLARLGPEHSRADWERALRRCGLLDLEPPPGEVGEQIRGIQRLIREWPRPRAEDPNLGFGEPREWIRAVGPGWSLAFAVAISLGFTWSCAAGDLRGVLLTAVLLAAVAWLREALKARQAPDADPTRWSSALSSRTRSLIARSFVTAIGETVVENTPHVEYLELREEQLGDAERAVEGHLQDMAETLERVRAANRRMGRPEEDLETEQLRSAIHRERASLQRIVAVRAKVRAMRDAFLVRLDTLRAAAERDALSERVARMAAGNSGVQRTVAEIDVDVAELETAFAALALDAREADVRRASVLEMVGATSGPRPLSRTL